MNDNKQPDWDKITEGKIRHGFALASFTKGDTLSDKLVQDIESWVRYVVDGHIGDGLPDGEELFPEDKTSVNATFDVIIRKQAEALKKPDADKVIQALESGKITEQNLDECLQRINDIVDGYGEL